MIETLLSDYRRWLKVMGHKPADARFIAAIRAGSFGQDTCVCGAEKHPGRCLMQALLEGEKAGS